MSALPAYQQRGARGQVEEEGGVVSGMMNFTLVLATINLSLGGLVFLLGLVILRENPHQRLNRVVSLMLFFGGFGAVLSAAAFLSPQTTSGGASTQGLLTNFAYLWEFFFPSLFLFASIFPTERAFTRRVMLLAGRLQTPGFGLLVFGPHSFHFALLLVLAVWKPEVKVPDSGLFHYFGPVLEIGGVFARLFLMVHKALFSLVNLGFGVATVALLFDSYRRARLPRLRQQLRVIAVGLSASLVLYSFGTSIPTLLGMRLSASVQSSLTTAALILGSGAIAYSIVRYKFLDTQLIARRTILYALTSAAMVGIYLVAMGQLRRTLRSFAGVDPRVFETVFLIMALALFQPVIARLEEILDRMLLKDPSDYRNVLRQLSRDLQTTIELETLLSRTVRTLSEALLLRTTYAVALTREGAVAHAGAGKALTEPQLLRLAGILPLFPRSATSFRLSQPIEDLTDSDRDFLTLDLGVELVVPLRWRSELLGALLLGEKLTGTAHTSEDVSLLLSLAGQMAVSLQNALLLRERVQVARFEEELNLARQIQRTFLLSEFPDVPRCEVHAVNIPSKHVGGDYYDVVPTGDGAFLLAVADVAGKGVPAALLSAMLQASLRTQARSISSVTAILRNINALVYRSTAVHQFATFFLARVDGENLRLTFCNAGHNWPLLLRASGERVFLERGGMILGIQESPEYEEERISLHAGDLVVFYTDGISEAINGDGELFGEERLCAAVESLPRGLSAREVAERLLEAVRIHLADVEAQDDITLVVLRVLERALVDERVESRPPAVAAAR